MTIRNYTNVSPPVPLTAPVTDVATVLNVSSTSGYPAVPFTLSLERGTPDEELVLCTAKGGTSFTVTRGYDSTVAVAHAAAASVEHAVGAIDYREANDHINNVGLDHHTQYLNAARHDATDHTSVLLATGLAETGSVLDYFSYWQVSPFTTFGIGTATQLLSPGITGEVTFIAPSNGHVAVFWSGYIGGQPDTVQTKPGLVLIDGGLEVTTGGAVSPGGHSLGPTPTRQWISRVIGASRRTVSWIVPGLAPASSHTYSLGAFGESPTTGYRITVGDDFGPTLMWVVAL